MVYGWTISSSGRPTADMIMMMIIYNLQMLTPLAITLFRTIFEAETDNGLDSDQLQLHSQLLATIKTANKVVSCKNDVTVKRFFQPSEQQRARD